MSNDQTLKQVEAGVGWEFKDKNLLIEALTHSTFAHENPEFGAPNERLEFLGDAVLDLVVATRLLKLFPEEREGMLSRRRAAVVQSQALADIGKSYGLDHFLLVGGGIAKDRQERGLTKRVLSSAFEALVGAIYLDGGVAAVESCFGERLQEAIEQSGDWLDYKTILQEHCHREKQSVPEYKVMEVGGEEHSREYTCSVYIEGKELGTATSTKKKSAEQLCAQKAMIALGL